MGRFAKGLGIYVVDCENNREYRSSFDCPLWLLNSMDTNAKTPIGPLELLAVLCAVLTFPEFLKDRKCVFFINNTQALLACIHGYCRNTDMGRLCNLLHLSLAACAVNLSATGFPQRPTQQTCRLTSKAKKNVLSSSKAKLNRAVYSPTPPRTLLPFHDLRHGTGQGTRSQV